MKKSLIIIITILLYLLVTVFYSCKKWLDEKPGNGLLTPTTLEDLQGLLDNSSQMNKNLTPGLGDVCADDYFLTQSRFDALTNAPASKDFYLWTKTKYNFPNDWSHSYEPVYTANYCLEQLTRIQRSSENQKAWDNVKGAALFYRAFNFLNLLWVYSKAYDKSSSNVDLGIVLRLGSDFNEPSVRANAEDGYQQVISDTKQSIDLLPELPSHVFRPSKWAAYALLARTYFSMRVYDSAFTYVNKTLEIRDELLNFSQLNVDDIFPFPQFNKEIIFYSEMYDLLPNVVRGYFDTTLVSSYSTADLRSKAYFRKSGSYYQRKGTYAGDQGKFTGLAVDEMIMIRAECYARKRDLASALEDLNNLLRNRYDSSFLPIEVSDPGILLSTILNERRKELINRGLRWIDVKRLNKEGANIIMRRLINGKSYTIQPNDNFYALPLPEDIIQLTNVPQNP